MSPGLFIIVLTAAVFHAAWNFVARKMSGNLTVFWLALWVAIVVLLPVVYGLGVIQGSEAIWRMTYEGYPYMIATGVLHFFYFLLLARAYEHGEISVVYPVARGSGIGVTALCAWMFLHEDITALGAVGIALVCLGILSMGAVVGRNTKAVQGFISALGVGATIVAYSLIDKLGVGIIHPILYIWTMYVITALILAPMILSRSRGKIRQIWRTSRSSIVLIGIGSSGTYMMILYALTIGPVSYIVALREFAVVIGALLGVVFLKESLPRIKLIAIGAIMVGLVCIKLAN